MSTSSSTPSPALPERILVLRNLLTKFEAEGLETLDAPQIEELNEAINKVWPQTYIVDSWYEGAERAALVIIGIMIGVLAFVLIGHFFWQEVPPCLCPLHCA